MCRLSSNLMVAARKEFYFRFLLRATMSSQTRPLSRRRVDHHGAKLGGALFQLIFPIPLPFWKSRFRAEHIAFADQAFFKLLHEPSASCFLARNDQEATRRSIQSMDSPRRPTPLVFCPILDIGVAMLIRFDHQPRRLDDEGNPAVYVEDFGFFFHWTTVV